MTNQLYLHDCKECVFVGRAGGNDLYCHPHAEQYTFIRRHSNEPSDYTAVDSRSASGAKWDEVANAYEKHQNETA